MYIYLYCNQLQLVLYIQWCIKLDYCNIYNTLANVISIQYELYETVGDRTDFPDMSSIHSLYMLFIYILISHLSTNVRLLYAQGNNVSGNLYKHFKGKFVYNGLILQLSTNKYIL